MNATTATTATAMAMGTTVATTLATTAVAPAAAEMVNIFIPSEVVGNLLDTADAMMAIFRALVHVRHDDAYAVAAMRAYRSLARALNGGDRLRLVRVIIREWPLIEDAATWVAER